MIYEEKNVKDVKIAYIGGGSRGWAWTLMNDLAKAQDMSGSVYLYDIDFDAAKNNEIIGGKIGFDNWKYIAVRTIQEALTGADFVILSILPGTFNEMASDVHEPEKFGIYQSVGDTTGPGGLFRALRTIPMIQEIALAIKEYAPNTWVINYTNPMALCIKTLYETFPQIKAFGCCHEVFGTQKLLSNALMDIKNIEGAKRKEICVNIVGVNHFTWFTKATYKNLDLFNVYNEFVNKYYERGFTQKGDLHWANSTFHSAERVKFDLYRRFGYIAAAGDRHLAEFMDGEDYLASPETVKKWHFGLTSVDWRKNDLQEKFAKSNRLMSGEEKFEIKETGEEGVLQMRALLGLDTLVTNVNVPNKGQITNLPLGSIVETNAVLRANSLEPVQSGEVPSSIYKNVIRVVNETDETVKAGLARDISSAFCCFAKGHLVSKLNTVEKEKLFKTMFKNTELYLAEYK